jgi:hypothetical protein
MKYRKAMQIVSVSFIALGLAGVGGATDLCTSPNNSLAVLVLGMAIAVMVFKKRNGSATDQSYRAK